MKNLKRVQFSSRYFYIVFSVIAIFFISYVYLQYKKEIRKSNLNLEHNIELVGQSLLDRLKTIDKLYYLLEKQIDSDMNDVLEEIGRDYLIEKKLKEDYSAYVEEFPFMEFYIIDANDRIIYGTDTADVGLDFSKTKYFSKKLDNIRASGKYFSDRINLSTVKGEITKYSYYPSFDKKYIFEVGYKMEEFQDFLGYDTLGNLGSAFETSNKSISEINFYNYQGGNFSKENHLSDAKENRRFTYHTEAIETGVIKRFSIEKGAIKKSYVYYPYNVMSGKKIVISCTLEIVYSNENIIKSYKKEMYKKMALITIFLLFLLFINSFFRRKFVLPMGKVLDGIDRVKANDFNTIVEVDVNNEIKILADHFNQMVQSVEVLLEEKQETNERLSEALKNNKRAYLETVSALATSLEVKDEYTGGHCERVTEMSLILADYLNLPEKTKGDLRFGSLLHDIGKIGIVDRILNKPGSFTDEEYAIIKRHPKIGYEIIKNIEFLDSAKEIVLSHHERIDGRGYPDGLKGDEIPYLARILTITDAFDAMTSKRVYKEKVMTVEEAFEEMRRCSGTQFDSQLLESFIKAYKNKFGSELKQNAKLLEVANRNY